MGLQFWSGKEWVPYDNLVAWYECDETTRFIIQKDDLKFATHSINEKLNTETKLSFAKQLDDEQSNDNNIPRIGTFHLHLKGGSFPLNFLDLVQLSSNTSETSNKIKLVFDSKIPIPAITLNETINDMVKEQLNSIMFPRYFQQFLMKIEHLKELLQDHKNEKLVKLVASYRDRALVHLEYMSKNPKSKTANTASSEIKILNDLAKDCCSALTETQPTKDFHWWFGAFSALFQLIYVLSPDSVESQLDELIKQLKERLDNYPFESICKKNLFFSHSEKINEHKIIVRRYPCLYESEFVQLCLFIEDLLILLDEVIPINIVESHIESKITDLKIFSSPIDKLKKLVEELKKQLSNCQDPQIVKVVTPHHNNISKQIETHPPQSPREARHIFEFIQSCSKALNDKEHDHNYWVKNLNGNQFYLIGDHIKKTDDLSRTQHKVLIH